MTTPVDHKCVSLLCDPICNRHVFYMYTKFEFILLKECVILTVILINYADCSRRIFQHLLCNNQVILNKERSR
jgi:hypothetical protein